MNPKSLSHGLFRLLSIFALCLQSAQLLASESGALPWIGVEQKLAQKIRMIDHVLNSQDLVERIEASDDKVAGDLLARAADNYRQGKAYFDQGQFLEAEAVLDYVLRDLSASSQLVNMSRLNKNKFAQFIERLDAFVLPEWQDLDETGTEWVQRRMQEISELRARAIRLADEAAYDKAIVELEQAYAIKTSLLEQLRHRTTVVYDLNFASVQDEYRYLLGRTYHYLEMVHLALLETSPDIQVRNLTDAYIYRSMLHLERAEDFEVEGSFSEAIPVLEESIGELTAALKVLGIDI